MHTPTPIRHRSFPPVVDAETRLLILGSLPGVASLAASRYYAHPQNQFWRLVGGAIGQDLVTLGYDERLAALRDQGIGLWDMVAEAAREGSLDSAIRDQQANDLAGLAETLPNLRGLAFNGKTSATLAMRHFPQGFVRYATIALPSTSPAYTLSVAEKQRVWMAIADHLIHKPDVKAASTPDAGSGLG